MQSIQTLLLIDALLANWQQIQRLFAENADDAGLTALARIGASLNAGTIDRVLDDLLDLTEDTPAENYVADLIERHSIDSAAMGIERGTTTVDADLAILQARADRMSEEDAANLHAATQRSLADQRCVAVPVYYATNREQVGKGSGAVQFPAYSGNPAADLSLGRAVVSIPVEVHRMGRVELPPWWKRYLGSVDKARYMAFESVETLAQSEFQKELERDATRDGRRDVLVFMHGYNVSFEEAAMRAAQVSYDLGFPGIVVLFSWPSLAKVLGYLADGDRAQTSGKSLASLLGLLSGGPWQHVHLMAHSMGNRVLLSGLADNDAPDLPIGQIVMVAADVYQGQFQLHQPKIANIGQLLTSYVSSTDRALFVSRFLHQAGRIGYAGNKPFVSQGMDTVDATSINTSFLGLGLGHSYFSDKRPMLTDLGYLLQHGLPASQREGLRASPDNTYWTFPN